MGLFVPSIPHLVHIETTYACNQRCLFCYNPNGGKKVDLKIVDRIVQQISEESVPHVYLIGGEPSLLGAEKLNQYIELLSGRSSVTVVTNGQIYLDGISDKLACIGVPIHGLEATHDYLARNPGSFRKAVRSAERYVKRGFDVRCIPVLTSSNFDQMYGVIKLARDLGMESVFVDRFEDGGMGSLRSLELRPSLEQFQLALGQMIRAMDELKMPVGWGTAIPFCLDERLVREHMTADCGAGTTFCAVSPTGNVRVCNQSERIYGNVLVESLKSIWCKPELGEFRNLDWVEAPCAGCSTLSECLCGCKVDVTYSDRFSVDYSVRGKRPACKVTGQAPTREPEVSVPSSLRRFKVNRYMRLNDAHAEKYLVTRYQTIVIDEYSEIMLRQILAGVNDEEVLIGLNSHEVGAEEVRLFLSVLALAGAIDILD